MRRILATLILLGLFVVPAAAGLNPYTYLKSISVLQTAGRNMCSVTAINKEQGYYLTAAHCVLQNFPSPSNDPEESGPPEVQEPVANENMTVDGRAAILTDVNVLEDLAVLYVKGATRPALKLATKSPRYLDAVTMAGHPFGWDYPTVMIGTVASPYLRFTKDPTDFPFNKYYMILQVSGAPGNSGSSVVNANMEVISVVQISWARTFAPVMGGAPYRELVKFASRYFSK